MTGPKPPSGGRRWIKRLGIAALIVVVVIAAIAGYSYQRARAVPERWKKEQDRIATMAPSKQLAVAESLRNRLINEWTAAEPSAEFRETDSDSPIGQRRRFAIPYDELNVWLHVEGRSLLEGLGITLPGQVQHAMVSGTADGNLVFAIEDGAGSGGGRIYTMTFDIDIAKDGTLTSTLLSAQAGKLDIPAEAAAQLLAATGTNSSSGGNLLGDLLTGKAVPPRDLPIDPGDQGFRDGRIVGLEVNEKQIVVTRLTIRQQRDDPPD